MSMTSCNAIYNFMFSVKNLIKLLKVIRLQLACTHTDMVRIKIQV